MTHQIPKTELDTTILEPSLNGSGPADELPGRRIRDIFDPEACLDDEDEALQVGAPVITIPVRKPDKLKHYRVHPTFVVDRYILVLREGMDESTYLVYPELVSLLPEAINKARIYPYINRNNTVALWRINHPKQGSRRNQKMFSTAVAAAEAARMVWTRVWWNADTSTYNHQPVRADLPDPQWPDMDFKEMLRLGFDDMVIDSPDHPVLQEIEGRV